MIFQHPNISGCGQASLKVNLEFFWHCQVTQKNKKQQQQEGFTYTRNFDVVKSPLVVEGEGKACSSGPPKISLKGSRIAFPGQLEQRICQHKLPNVFVFQWWNFGVGNARKFPSID